MTAIVGVIANPIAGKDVRRLVSAASPTTDLAKIGVLRRVAIGAVEGGAERVVFTDDRASLARHAIRELRLPVPLDILDEPIRHSGGNSTVAAERFRDMGCGAVVVLGGDGTHRDVALGWRDATLAALSTGTNNVFPRMVEATLAGHAAGAVASGQAPHATCTRRATWLDVDLGDRRDLALVDVALVEGRFTGSRAVWDASSVREVVASIAEPDSVGLSAIAAAGEPVDRYERAGAHVTLQPPDVDHDANAAAHRHCRVAIGPGMYADARVASGRRLAPGDTVALRGPGVLAFDGERDHVLADGDCATVTLRTDGPHVIDVTAAMAAAVGARASQKRD